MQMSTAIQIYNKHLSTVCAVQHDVQQKIKTGDDVSHFCPAGSARELCYMGIPHLRYCIYFSLETAAWPFAC